MAAGGSEGGVSAIVFFFPKSPKQGAPAWEGDQVHPLPNVKVTLDVMSKPTEEGRKPMWLPLSPPRGGLHETWSTLNIYWEKYIHWNGQIYILSDMLEAYVLKSSLRIYFSGYMLKDYSC